VIAYNFAFVIPKYDKDTCYRTLDDDHNVPVKKQKKLHHQLTNTLMKKAIFILMAVAMATVANAQSFQNGTTTVNAGIGLGTALGGLGKARPAISVSLDHGFWDIGGPGVISLGGYVGNTGYKYTDPGYTAKWNYVIVGVRGAY